IHIPLLPFARQLANGAKSRMIGEKGILALEFLLNFQKIMELIICSITVIITRFVATYQAFNTSSYCTTSS
ncbi:TPA: hypothetical protein ACJKDE_002205, partial [Neisseria meningitidis]